ncbi:MAG: amidohydrolase family protein [Bradymonadia bacterium]
MISIWATLAIVGATVHTGDGAPLEKATVIIEGDRVTAVGVGIVAPAGAEIIDGAGKVVTAGLIDPSTGLGLEEISGVGETVDRAPKTDDPIRAALDAGDVFNPFSAVIPVQRAHGVTAALTTPRGGLVSGRARAISLSKTPALVDTPGAMVIRYGGLAEGSRATQWVRLVEALDEAAFFERNATAWRKNKTRDLALSAVDLAALVPVMRDEQPLLVYVDRRADVRTVLRLKARFPALRIIIASGAEAWLEVSQLAQMKVPVIVDPSVNQPTTMDRVHAREDAAAILHRAGVPVMLSTFSTHNVRKLRQWAGNAVRAGLPHEAALQAITTTPAQIFGLKDRGVIARGAIADVVVWSGDPFELSTHAEVVIIGGEVQPSDHRQRQLMERYRAPGRPGMR